MAVNTADEAVPGDDERVDPASSLGGWRRFVEKDHVPFDLVPPAQLEAMGDDERDVYNEARMDFHSEFQVVRTSTVREVAHQGRLLT